jgi:hypothetical protein
MNLWKPRAQGSLHRWIYGDSKGLAGWARPTYEAKAIRVTAENNQQRDFQSG